MRAPGCYRFLIQVREVVCELVDDLRFTLEGEARHMLADTGMEIHDSAHWIEAGNLVQRAEQLVPAGTLLGKHPASVRR